MRIVVEGLDCVGKTTLAKKISDYSGLPYLKIHKTCEDGKNTEETVNNIVNEISLSLGRKWEGVLDRGYWSAIGTSLALYDDFNPKKVKRPRNLVPNIGVLLLSDLDVILKRNKSVLTEQDKNVLKGNYFQSQIYLEENIDDKYFVIENNSNDLGDLDKYAGMICEYVDKNKSLRYFSDESINWKKSRNFDFKI